MEQLRVHWSEFPLSLTGALGQLQHAGDLADVTLACEGRRILAHKLVLSACSPYFREAFMENPCHHPIIILKGVQAQDILYLLSYMYRGEVNVEENKLPSFFQTAELLQIKGLSETPPKPAPFKRIAPKLIPAPQKQNSLKTPASQKRRRNSAGEKPSDVPDLAVAVKKLKPLKEKNVNIKTLSNPSNTPNISDVSQSPSRHENNEPEINPPIEIIKHELIDSETEHPTDEGESTKDSTAPSSPNAYYETSMLARSLISGAQVLKNESSPSNSLNKSKPPIVINLQSGRDDPASKTPPPDETVVKTERMSPRSDIMELEPEVLISEHDDSAPGGRKDQASTSQQQSFNQTNHAAICGDCPHCGTKYSNQSALKYHVRLMHSDLTNRLCCYLCPRSFTIRETFKEHMWTSHGQRN